MKNTILIIMSLLSLASCKNKQQKKEVKEEKEKITINNPFIKGYYADPSIVKYQDKYYVYATIDPWGGDELAVFESSDFINWEQKHIGWPTKEACTSDTSNDSMVWAPSVIQGEDGNFYMYVSVGSEVWAGVSEHPLGPWKNAKEDNTPFIKGDMYPEYHMIDAEVFIDTDHKAYLYWGSGLHWVNGHCFVVKLNKDMVSFDATKIKDITPPNYFEAPFMLKKKGTYYLMYSDGKCLDETYKVRYAVGSSPYGPWAEAKNSAILSSSKDSITLGPGHHTVLSEKGQDYIVYHRIYNNEDTILRELCIDSLNFESGGEIKKVKANTGIISFVP